MLFLSAFPLVLLCAIFLFLEYCMYVVLVVFFWFVAVYCRFTLIRILPWSVFFSFLLMSRVSAHVPLASFVVLYTHVVVVGIGFLVFPTIMCVMYLVV